MKSMTKNFTLAAALTLALASLGAGMAHAEDAPAAPEAKPDNELSYNAAIVSDYRYRGLSQTRLNRQCRAARIIPTIRPASTPAPGCPPSNGPRTCGGSGDVEWDIYGGKRGEITKDIAYDVGGLYYFYPSNGLTPERQHLRTVRPDCRRARSRSSIRTSTTNLFGTGNSKNSGYLDCAIQHRRVRRLQR